ncbi:MAG: DUF2298 domain-containing protein, partial [Chloroflexota bacterium]
MFRRLPDRGYAFARVLGLVTVTYITWIVGSFLPIAGGVVLPGLVSVAGFVGWALRGRQVLRSLAQVKTAVVVEESLFLAGLIAWSALRAYVFHPDIAHTEQFMDMAFLSATLHAGSFPPLDPWMSGHTINYYYLGYLMNAILIRFSGVAPAVGYNLALSTIFALTLSGAYSLGYFLTRRLGWASVMPLFVVVLGNWHAVLVQLPQHQFPASGNGWFFDSTRVVGGGATINEFPFFSLMLGDLHPHVMSLPVTLLAIALGATFLYAEREPRLRAARLLVAAVVIGMLFTINSWDFPTYLLLAGACIAAGGYLASDRPDWWKVPALSIVALAVASVVLYTPFFLHFRSLADGIGVVTTRSDIFQVIQVFG